jgi:two-component system OmpR family sensor kinase
MSPGCCTRSVEPATSSEPEAPNEIGGEAAAPERRRTPLSHLPIRVRLATGVAIVMCAILSIVAVAVGIITVHRLRANFNDQLQTQAQNVAGALQPVLRGDLSFHDFENIVTIDNGVAVVYGLNGQVLYPRGAQPLGPLVGGIQQAGPYAVDTIEPSLGVDGALTFILQFGLPVAPLQREIGNLELLLALGVLAGTVLGYAAGALVARRAITPIAELTAAAADIARTRDPNRTLPEPTADDEVAELSRTLRGMLDSLASAQDETESTLERQRAFVADASHELRTPLTSVLANLELLVDSVPDGADRQAAQSALRSTQRMRRLVGDLLLLARSDAGRPPALDPLDLASVVTDAASELEPAANEHVLELDALAAPARGSRDDLQRVATNLIENALRHTPPGTHIAVTTRTLADGRAEMVVADDGPGIPPDMRETLFNRFSRGAGDRGGSFGLGLAIVAAVVQAHGGTVTADSSPHDGARFTVTLPPAEATEPAPAPELVTA